MGISMTDAHIASLFKQLDERNTGTVHFDDFARVLFVSDNMLINSVDHRRNMAGDKAKKLAAATHAVGCVHTYVWIGWEKERMEWRGVHFVLAFGLLVFGPLVSGGRH